MAADANHNNIAYGLTRPGRGWTDRGRTGAPPAVTCTTLIPVQRFELVLDRSGSMVGAKFDQLKIGANFWVDYVNPLEELGTRHLLQRATTDVPRTEVPAAGPAQTAWRTDRHTIVDGLAAGGRPRSATRCAQG